MFITLSAIPSSDVATNGTIAFTIPSPYAANNFATYGHAIWCSGLQKLFTEDAGGITVSISGVTATVTYKGSTSIPANTLVRLQLNQAGADDRRIDQLLNTVQTRKTALYQMELGTPATAAANNICASQSIAATAALNGTLVSNGVAVLDVPRNVVAAWTTAAVLTVTGKDAYNNTIVESSASGTSFTGKKAFKLVTSVTVSTAVTSATVGTGTVLGLPFFVENNRQIRAEFEGGFNIAPPRNWILPWQFPDPNTPVNLELVVPYPGFIIRARAVTMVANTTGGDITFNVNTVAVVGLTLTLGNADAIGTRYSDTPTTARSATTVVAAGDRITVAAAAAITAAQQLNGALEMESLGCLGAFVGGVTGVQSATTGDVRGSFSPLTAPDGSTSYGLLIESGDVLYRGGNQFAG